MDLRPGQWIELSQPYYWAEDVPYSDPCDEWDDRVVYEMYWAAWDAALPYCTKTPNCAYKTGHAGECGNDIPF